MREMRIVHHSGPAAALLSRPVQYALPVAVAAST